MALTAPLDTGTAQSVGESRVASSPVAPNGELSNAAASDNLIALAKRVTGAPYATLMVFPSSIEDLQVICALGLPSDASHQLARGAEHCPCYYVRDSNAPLIIRGFGEAPTSSLNAALRERSIPAFVGTPPYGCQMGRRLALLL